MTTHNQEKTNINEQVNFEEKYLKYKTKYNELKKLADAQTAQPIQTAQTSQTAQTADQIVQIGGLMAYNVYHNAGSIGQAKQACQRVISGCDDWFRKMSEWSKYHDTVTGSEQEDARREINKMLDDINGLFEGGRHEFRFFWSIASWNLGSRWL